jgi:hypothetical protein
MMGSDGFGRYGRSRSLSPGIVLVGLGVLFLLWHLLAPTGALPLLILGGIFTGVALSGGGRGFVVPGSLMLGLGGGVLAGALLGHLSGAYGGAAVVGGLGAGFWMIPVLDAMRHPHIGGFEWARIPGTILLGLAGFLALLGTASVAARTVGLLFHYWPVLLILGGLWLFIASRRRGGPRWS